MALASTNLAQLSLIPEDDFGVTPVTGAGAKLRMTGESLNFNLSKETDKEINAEAQLTSSTTVGADAGGDIKIHMQYAEYDPLFASVMRSTWDVFGTNGVGATFTADFTSTTITASVATSGTSIFTDLQPGQWFRLTAPSHANDGRWVRVSTSVAPTTTVLTLDANTTLATGTAVTLCKVATSRLTNGVVPTSFTIEKNFTDVTQIFAFRGMYPTKFSTSFASKQLTEGTFTFIGKEGERITTTSLPGSTAASQTYEIQNAVTGVGHVWEGTGPLTSTYIKSLSLDIDSQLRAQDAIGNLGMIGAGVGTFMAKGTMEMYFADGSMYDKFLADTYTQIILSTEDAAGNGYVFTLPRVQLMSGKIEAGSRDADLMASFEYQAYGDKANATAALRYAMFIDRLGAAVTAL